MHRHSDRSEQAHTNTKRGRRVKRAACQCSWQFAQQGAMKSVYLVTLSDRRESTGISQGLLPATHLTGGLCENSAETLLYMSYC